jgi:hypothetical protein
MKSSIWFAVWKKEEYINNYSSNLTTIQTKMFVKQTSSIVAHSPPKAPPGAGIIGGGMLWPITLDPYKVKIWKVNTNDKSKLNQIWSTHRN